MLYVSRSQPPVPRGDALDTDLRSRSSRDSVMHPSGAILIFRSLWHYLPDSLIRLTDYLPTREARRFRRTVTVINRLSKKLINEKTQACLDRKDENLRDIMSILGEYALTVVRGTSSNGIYSESEPFRESEDAYEG